MPDKSDRVKIIIAFLSAVAFVSFASPLVHARPASGPHGILEDLGEK
ncbi:hypothetical protein ACFL42_00305 [Candidatus Omnitrophota bacterium]